MEATVGEVLRAGTIRQSFTVVAGAHGLDRQVRSKSIQRLGVGLTGYTKHLDVNRIQLIGQSETGYLATLAPLDRLKLLSHLIAVGFPAVVITTGLQAPPELIELAEMHDCVIISTELESADAIDMLNTVLAARLSPRESMHGCLLDVYGVGVLITGKSGIGKSELALELVEHGARLVADDVVVLHQLTAGVIIGAATELSRHHMEIRGIGIINVKDLFGAAAVRERKRVEIIVELMDWDPEAEYDRIGVETRHMHIAGVPIPHLTIPVRPGRSLRLIVEVAARNRLLQAQGIHSAQAFTERLTQLLSRGAAPLADHSEADFE
ncbi:MAG: HPr(Ser) kinase/phosphatase [Bradymonadia bacterium]